MFPDIFERRGSLTLIFPSPLTWCDVTNTRPNRPSGLKGWMTSGWPDDWGFELNQLICPNPKSMWFFENRDRSIWSLYGCFQKRWVKNPQNHPFLHRVFHYFSPSILGYHHLRKHPYKSKPRAYNVGFLGLAMSYPSGRCPPTFLATDVGHPDTFGPITW